MSRSNPTQELRHPASRWFSVNGQKGEIQYYDKEQQKNFTVPLPFNFLLLDELAVIRGWHEASESRITSNEVRSTRDEQFVVKTFKKGGMPQKLAEGFYQFIKDKVAVQGGSYHASLYIAFKGESGRLEIGNLMLRGASLGAWFEFAQKCRKNPIEVDGKKLRALDVKAVQIKSFTEGKKGSIKFMAPAFSLLDIKPETNAEAVALDGELQAYLASYFAKSKVEAAEPHPGEAPQPEPAPEEYREPEPETEPEPESEPEPPTDDVPF